MNRLRDKPQPEILNTEALHECFKGALIAHVTETASIEHVERNCVRMVPWVFVESELRVRIDVAQDQPRRGNAVNPRLWACDPGSPDVVFGILLSFSPFFCAVITFELADGLFDSSTYRRPEEVNFNNLLYAPL